MTVLPNDRAISGIDYIQGLLTELKALLVSSQNRALSVEEHERKLELIIEYRNYILPSKEEQGQQFAPITGGSFTSELFLVGQDSYLNLKLREKEDE